MHFTITLTGTADLLMHNARLADPLDPVAKAMKKISALRKKTEDDHLEMRRLEHLGSLYYDPKAGPYIPAENIERCLVDAAKRSRRGTDLKAGMVITTNVNPLAYPGPRTPDELWADENYRHLKSSKVTTNRVMRCRPLFRHWSVEADGVLDTGLLAKDDFIGIAETAGNLIGLGDWRPRFGRFTVEVTAR